MERLKGKEFGNLQEELMQLDSANVDIGASNVEEFVKLMSQFDGSHEDWVFVGEHVPPRHYGLGIGILTSGITGGTLLGSLIAIAINRQFSPEQVSDFA